MNNPYTLAEIRSRTCKSRDAWWTVLLADPLAIPLVRLAAPIRWITPNRLTLAAFLLGLVAAGCFAVGDYPWLVAGAVVFHLSFVLDCMDGKIARLNGTGSIFGAWLDYILDRLRVVACAVALFGGHYLRTGQDAYLLVAGVVVFLDMFRYLNAHQMGKVKDTIRTTLAELHGPAAGPTAFLDGVAEHPIGAAPSPAPGTVDVYSDFRQQFSLFTRLRNLLVRHRIRVHLISGVEFEMAVFVIAPVTGALIAVPVVAAVLLLAFEALLIYKLYLATRSLDRHLAARVPAPRRAADDALSTPLPVS